MNDLVDIGKIIKSSGLKGRLKVLSYMESPEELESLEEVFVGATEKSAVPFRIGSIRIKEKSIFLELEGVTNTELSNTLLGLHLFIPSHRLGELKKDEYYWRDILGLDVVTEEGHILGRIEQIIPTGGNDVYVCTGGDREILLPAIEDVIRLIDIERGIVIVTLLEGL